MLMGRGKLSSVGVSRKQKLNVASSARLELDSIADVLGHLVCFKYSIEAQGYIIKSNILYQNNMSTTLLAKRMTQLGW